jgi:CRISPR-associated protein Csb2
MQITINFLKNHYHGAEWPPSPYRLFQALVNGLGDRRNLAAKEEVLSWLEKLPAPIISVSRYERSFSRLKNFQPDNDNQVTPDEHGVIHVRSGAQPLSRYVFLSTEPKIVYTCEEASGCPDERAFAQLVRSLIYLVRSEDLVYAEGNLTASTLPADRTFYPGGGFVKLAVPRPGFLQECIRRYPRQRAAFIPNHRLVQNVSYGLRRAEKAAPIAVFDAFRTNDTYLDFAPYQLRQLSGMVRGTMLNATRGLDPERVERLVAGHHGDGFEHIAVVPLPSMDENWNADGRLRRVALIGYGLLNEGDEEFFEQLNRRLDEASLIDHGQKVGTLGERSLKYLGYMRNFLGAKTSCRWKSLTPVVLHGFDSRKPLRKCLELDREELESATAYRGPILPTSEHPMRYQVADHLAKWPRVHLDVSFKKERCGPILLGRGRYVGLGLMVPV